jgi:glycosyltransferase involved in cell wall biosynthesis
MSAKLCEQGIAAPYVPNSVSAVFEAADHACDVGTVAVMPRKGAAVLDWLMERLGDTIRWSIIDGRTERQTAELLKAADVFLALSPHEAFGLPALEAMAAGCCVVGYPGDGGYEFMHHGSSAHVVPNGDRQGLLKALRFCLDQPEYREQLRQGGARVVSFYTPARERKCLYSALRWLGCV